MKTLVLDSNAIISLFDGDTFIAETMADAEQILIPAVVLAEVMLGFNGTKRARVAELALKRLLERDNVSVLDVTSETASFFVAVIRQLKAQGTPIPTNDIWIAAGVLERGAVLLTRDTHFSQIPLLRVISS